MDTQRLPRELAFDLARKRSPHPDYRMAAVVADRGGRIFAWGWNHPSAGTLQRFHSQHAEIHAISRANHNRLSGATIYVVGLTKAGRPILARPCDNCMAAIRKYQLAKVIYSTPTGFETLLLNQSVK